MIVSQVRLLGPALAIPLTARREFRGCGGRMVACQEGHCGWWVKLRVCCAAFSTAITKHTRSGPRLGNGAFVYLNEIGSMYRQSPSGRTSTTRPWIAAIRYGLAMSVTDKATRGSRRMSLAFQIASEVHTRTWSPSSPTQI